MFDCIQAAVRQISRADSDQLLVVWSIEPDMWPSQGPRLETALDPVGCNTANQVSGFLPNGQVYQYEPLRGISQLARMLAAPLHSDATLVPAHLRTGRPL